MEILWTGLGSLLNGNIVLEGGNIYLMFPIYGLAVLNNS